MRNYDDDDEDDYDEDHDHSQEQEQDNENDNEEEDDGMGGDDDNGTVDHSEEDNSDEEDEEDQDDDDDGDNDDDDDDDDEDDDEDHSTEDEDGDRDNEGDDVEMADGAAGDGPSTKSPAPTEEPPHLRRRRLFVPSYPPGYTTLSLDAIVGISTPSPVHSLAATMCCSYLLTGSQDGHVRAYDFWASVNGGQLMTAQQRAVVGLGEGVNKAGVARGWWSNEVEQGEGEDSWRALEPVYSMVCQLDGLWAATGTRSGPINLYTLRHSPGHLLHSLQGHQSVVSCLSLLPDEHKLLSGSWDGSVRDWDLNTGQMIRTYPTHGAQISSLALRPTGVNAAESLIKETNGIDVAINAGPDFFIKDREQAPATNGDGPHGPASPSADAKEERPSSPAKEAEYKQAEVKVEETPAQAQTNGDIEMDAPSPYDPLFDDADAEGESVLPSANGTAIPTPQTSPPPPTTAFGLALPGTDSVPPPAPTPKETPASTPLFSQPNAQAGPSRTGVGAAGTIPLLTRTTYDSFSEEIMMTSSMDGQVTLIDRRVPMGPDSANGGVGRLQAGEKAPPWCMSACWLGDGNQVLAGRRNGTVDIWDVRRASSSSRAPNLLRTLKTPPESGFISCVVGFTDGRHIATASQDNIRLWNTVEYFEPEDSMKKGKSRPPFKIVAGHHGGTISSMMVDPTNRWLITASGDRGWQGEATKVVLIHDVKAV